MSTMTLENTTNNNLNVPGFSLMLPPLVTETLTWDQETQDALTEGGDDLQALLDAGDLIILVPANGGGSQEVTDIEAQVASGPSEVMLQYYLNTNIPRNNVKFMKVPGTGQYMTKNPLVLAKDYNIVAGSFVVEKSDGNQTYALALYSDVRATPVFVEDIVTLPEGEKEAIWKGLKVPMVAGEKYALGVYQVGSTNGNSSFKKIVATITLESA